MGRVRFPRAQIVGFVGRMAGANSEVVVDRKEMVRRYKETPRPAGVYRVQHKPSGRTLLGSSPDAPAMLRRIQAQLRMNGHTKRVLQSDWNADGPDAFLFEVVDLLPPSEIAGRSLTEELATLEDLWREKLGIREDLSY